MVCFLPALSACLPSSGFLSHPALQMSLILPRVPGFAEEQAGTTEVCEASPCRKGWIVNDGMWLVLQQASSAVPHEWMQWV